MDSSSLFRASWYFLDKKSESGLEAVILPFSFMIFLLALVLKITWMIGPKTSQGNGSVNGAGGGNDT